MILAVLTMTPEQINAMPPTERTSIMQLVRVSLYPKRHADMEMIACDVWRKVVLLQQGVISL